MVPSLHAHDKQDAENAHDRQNTENKKQDVIVDRGLSPVQIRRNPPPHPCHHALPVQPRGHDPHIPFGASPSAETSRNGIRTDLDLRRFPPSSVVGLISRADPLLS
ncbi:hypothetical protein SVAN01_00991 [Stagonosporopsis vannaccii]|nr:hypothetical protein SVAN01_00991 [Stagonosporopsis vannaccii]